MRDSKGQNLIEYVLLVVAVLVVCIFFITSGVMKQSVNASINSVLNEINNVNGQIQFY
jgi:Flp pilus assembly pilin Flp